MGTMYWRARIGRYGRLVHWVQEISAGKEVRVRAACRITEGSPREIGSGETVDCAACRRRVGSE